MIDREIEREREREREHESECVAQEGCRPGQPGWSIGFSKVII